jgi:hypothetical protein
VEAMVLILQFRLLKLELLILVVVEEVLKEHLLTMALLAVKESL